MAEAEISEPVRTPIDRHAGGLAPVRLDVPGAIPLRTLTERNPGVDGSAGEEVILGCTNRAGEDNRILARMARLPAGLPDRNPGSRVNRPAAPARAPSVSPPAPSGRPRSG